ncbi:cofilin [Tulasnella sp. UAMH 9824]|nr:cofilin [Tulasnella sp. UAMH 9824]
MGKLNREISGVQDGHLSVQINARSPLPSPLLPILKPFHYISRMASSGVSVDQECLAVYNDLKLKKKYKYVTYKLNPGFTQIVVDKTSEDKDYETFLRDLPTDEPRWAVYDFEFTKEGAGQRNKLLFYSWSPDGARIKQKMVYSSSKDALRKALVGIAFEIQGTDGDDVEHNNVLERVSKGA